RPANLLVMDEPTNDLDVETLELLEELLMDYTGTLLLVSHDRAFLDNVVTSTLVFEGDGIVNEYVGGYSDWQRQRAAGEEPPEPALSGKPDRPARERAAGDGRPAKLSYRDQRELDALPARIEALEAEQAALQETVSDPDFYRQESAPISDTLARLEAVGAELEDCYVRWARLES
ncbi:MAG: ABC transporter ATP-binding protein, partial [Gammaproteobacteria bacterium]